LTRSGAGASRSIAQRAEALLRSLVGISQAEVHIRPTGGVERIRVVADGGLSNGQIVQNVRSALLATFGVLVQPAQIEFVPTGEWVPSPALVQAAEPAVATSSVAPVEPAASAPDHSRPIPTQAQPSINGSDYRNGASTARPGNGADQGERSRVARDSGEPVRRPVRPHSPLDPAGTAALVGYATSAATETVQPSAPVPETTDRGELAIGNRAIRLELVELVRQNGRVRCRVVLAAGTDRFSAVADACDEPRAELQLAARVACDALRAGELTTMHFEGATIAQLAGLAHVVVALNGWKAGAPVRRSGSAVIKESTEQAAALAVLHALANT